MKKILTFLFCLAVVYTNGQIYVQPNSTYGTQEYRRAILSTFHYPTGCGAPTDSTYLNEPGIKVRQNQAAIYYDSCGHHAYNWDPALRSWSLLGSGSGGGVDSIYNRTDSAFYRLNGVEEFAFLIGGDTTNLSARIDTLSTTMFAALALKVANFLGVSYIGYGIHSARPTSGTGLYYDTDSASFFRVNGASYTNLFPSFNVTVLGKGGPGDTTLVSASGGNLLVAAVRDSGCIVHLVNPDGSWTFYSFCALKNYWDSTAGKISPHGATDTVVMNRVVVNNRIDQTYTNTTAGAFNQTGFNGTDRNNAIGTSGSTINGIRRAYTPNGATFNLDIYNAFIADLSGAPSATVNTGSGFTTLLSSSTNWGTQNGFSVTYGGGGINRRAFATNIPAGTGNYAFYSSADAPSLFGGAIGINQSAPNASALLDIVSTTKGILTPRMNTTQMLAITTPPGGLLVFNIDSTSSLTGGYYYYDGVTSAWRPLSKANGGGGSGITQLFAKPNTPISILGTDTVKFNNNAIRRIFNVMDYGADSTFTNDCTVAVQATINAAHAAVGGVVYFPKGHFKISGSLITTGGLPGSVNAQILIPLTGPSYKNAPVIVIEGEKLPSPEMGVLYPGYTPLTDGGTIIESTIAGNGFIFGAKDTIFNITDTFNATHVEVKNITLRTNTKAVNGITDTTGSMSGIDFKYLTGCNIHDIRVDVTSEIANMTLPNHTYGIRLPRVDNSAWEPVRNVVIGGYYTGISITEHANLDYVSFSGCYDALVSEVSAHDWNADRVLVNGCTNGIHVKGHSFFKISNYDAEHFPVSRGARFFNFNSDIISDNFNDAVGNINYKTLYSGNAGTEDQFISINTNLQNVAISNMSQSPLPNWTVIGSQHKATFGSMSQPKASILEISSDSTSSGSPIPVQIIMTDSADGSNKFMGSFNIGNKSGNRPMFASNWFTYLNRAGFTMKEYLSSSVDSTLKLNLTRTPYSFELGVPLAPAHWTTTTRPTLALTDGMAGWNTDSLFWEYYHSGWHPFSSGGGGGGGSYTLPIAAAGVLGGIRVGSTLSIDAGTGILDVQGGAFTFEQTLTAGATMAQRHTINGNSKSMYWVSFDTLNFNANYWFSTTPLNINSGTPRLNYNSSNGLTNYAYTEVNSGTGEVKDFVRAGGFFKTFYSNNAEHMRLTGGGNLLVNGTSDSTFASVQVYAGGLALLSGRTLNNRGSLGMKLVSMPAVFTDGSTASGSHVPYVDVNNIAHDSLSAAAGSAVFYDTVVNTRIGLPPIAKTNVTLGQKYSLDVRGTVLIRDTFQLSNIQRRLLDSTNLKLVAVDALGHQFKTDWPTFGTSSGSNPTLQQVFNVGGGGKAFLTKSDTASGLSTNSLLLDSFPSVVIRANTFSDIEHIGTTARIAVYANTAQLNGALNVATIAINSSFTASQSLMPVQHVDLTAPSSNSTITLGSVATYIGYQWKFVNRNTTSFTWSFAGVALKDASGNTVTSFPNGYAYEIYCDGTNWLLKNATYVGAGPTGIPIAGSYSSTGTATTTFTVTIGITEPTTTYKVGFAPTDALAAGLYYITNKTATTFDVVYLSGLTGTVSFDWTITP